MRKWMTHNCKWRLTCAYNPRPGWRPVGPCSAHAGGFDIVPRSPTWPYDPLHSCSWSHVHHSDADKPEAPYEKDVFELRTITRSSFWNQIVVSQIENKLNCAIFCYGISFLMKSFTHKNKVGLYTKTNVWCKKCILRSTQTFASCLCSRCSNLFSIKLRRNWPTNDGIRLELSVTCPELLLLHKTMPWWRYRTSILLSDS